MDKKLIELYKSGHMVIPLYLLKNYKDLKLDLDEFIFLMYFPLECILEEQAGQYSTLRVFSK